MRSAYRHDRPRQPAAGRSTTTSREHDRGDDGSNARHTYTTPYRDVNDGRNDSGPSASSSSSSSTAVPSSYKLHLQQQQQQLKHSQKHAAYAATTTVASASAPTASTASPRSPSPSAHASFAEAGGSRSVDADPNQSLRSDSGASPEQPPNQKPEDLSVDGMPTKRRRIQQACKACSFRRVKCNGQCPCQTCIKNGEACVYGLAKKRGPAKGTTRGGKKLGGPSRETASGTSDPSRIEPKFDARPSGMPIAHSDRSSIAAARQQAARDFPPLARAEQRSTAVAEPPATHYDPSVTFADAYTVPPTSRRDASGWNEGSRRQPPPPPPPQPQPPPPQGFAQHPAPPQYSYPGGNGMYGPPPPHAHGHMQVSVPYHSARESPAGYSQQAWGSYSPPHAPQPPPSLYLSSQPPIPPHGFSAPQAPTQHGYPSRQPSQQAHGDYAVPPLPRESNTHYGSSPRIDPTRRGPPPLVGSLASSPPPAEPASIAAPFHRDSPSRNVVSDGASSTTGRAKPPAASPRPAHLVPPGPAMHQQPNRVNPDRITRKPDINNDELADLVLAQVYHERRQARSSKGGGGGTGAKEDWAAFNAAASGGTDELAPDGSNAAAVTDEILDRLFQVFWNVTSLHWPMFPRQQFPTVTNLREHIESRHPLLVNAICSIAALTWDVNRDGGELDSRPENEALSTRELSTIFSLRAHYHHIAAVLAPSLESTAAMVLLSLRETGAGRPSQAAHYCWTACRMAMDLSLHRHAEMAQIMGASFTAGQDEMRRRIYWSVYVIDKMMAVQLGRPPVLRDSESDCPLPAFAGDEAVYAWTSLPRNFFSDETNRKLGPQPLTVATYFTNGCRLACISEGIIAQYNVVKYKHSGIGGGGGVARDAADWQSSVAKLHGRLVEWERNTPANLKWESKAAESYFPFVIHQQVWAQACKILLHRPYILKPTDAESGLNSHEQCSRATDAICQMFIKHKELYGLRRVPSSMVYCLFSAATIALANTTSPDEDVSDKAKQQLTFCVEWFMDMMETWASATQHLAILQNLASTINVNLAETGLIGEALHEALQQKMNSAGLIEKLNATAGSAAVVASSGAGVWAASSLSSSSRPLADVGGVGGGGVVSSPASGLPWMSTQTNADATLHSSGASDAMGGGGAPSTITTAEGTTPGGGGGGGQDGLQALDAFWPDMPLGEDFQRWLSFTHTYFAVLGTSNASGNGASKAYATVEPAPPPYPGISGDPAAHRHVSSLPSQSSESFYPLPPFAPNSSL